MKTFTFFALMMCAIFAFVGAAPNPMAPAEIAVDGLEAIPADDMLEGAESRGYGYPGRGGGGGYGHGHHHHHGHHYGYGR